MGSDAFVEAIRRKVPAGRDLARGPAGAGAGPPAKPLAHYAHTITHKSGTFAKSEGYEGACLRLASPLAELIRHLRRPTARRPGGAEIRVMTWHYAREQPDRDRAIAAAYASGGYNLREIGNYFGLYCSRISKIVQAASRARGKVKGKTPCPCYRHRRDPK